MVDLRQRPGKGGEEGRGRGRGKKGGKGHPQRGNPDPPTRTTEKAAHRERPAGRESDGDESTAPTPRWERETETDGETTEVRTAVRTSEGHRDARH